MILLFLFNVFQQQEELRKLLGYFFDLSNPVIYSLIITLFVFTILFFFYSAKIIPEIEARYEEMRKQPEVIEAGITELINMNPDPLLKVNAKGIITDYNASALLVLPELEGDNKSVTTILPEMKSLLNEIIGKEKMESFTFERRKRFFFARITSLPRIDCAMIHAHDSTAYFPFFDQYNKMIDTVSEARDFVMDRIEAEQARIAKELHDSIGQIFSTAKIQLVQLQKASDLNEVNEMTKDSIKLLSTGIDELKEVSFRLLPKVLEHKGLIVTIEEMIHRVLNKRFFGYEFRYEGNFDKLPPRLEVALYRIIQEIISNIIKHSGANKINIILRNTENIIRLFISDNGIGFDFKEALDKGKRDKNMGLTNIVDRVNLFGGTYNFDSNNIEGTIIDIEIPLEAVKNERTKYFGFIS